jgi:hypothetical protein
MLPACAALVASLALQAGVARYTASVQTQAQYFTDLEALAPVSATALEVVPYLGLTYEERTSSFGVAYFPRLFQVVGSPPPQFFHQASLNLALQPDPGLRLSGAAIGCYGTNDFRIQYALACGAAVLAPAPGAGPQPIPQVSTVKYMSASGALGVESRLSARILLSATASYLAQGGADAPTRAVLPLQRGPSFLVALGWTAGRRDSLTTSLSGSYYAFLRENVPPGANEPTTNAWISQLLEVWQHDVGRQGRLRLGLGVGVAGNAVDFPRLVIRRTSLVAEASFQQAFGRQEAPAPDRGEQRPEAGLPGWSPAILLTVGARVAPFVDFTSGLAYNRAEAFASLGWPLDLDWRLDASLSGGIALDGIQREQATATGQLAATWMPARWLRLSTGLNGLWQRAGVAYPATSTIRQVGFFLGATFLESGRL